jgi:D-sedoheptulose 7-phosphate isomerase
MNMIDKIFFKSDTIDAYSIAYMKYLNEVLSRISVKEISRFIELLLDAREKGTCIYFIGNGGSAATATHFANDIAIGTKDKNKPFRAVSLCDNQSIITAIGNDYGFDQVFSRQLEVCLRKNDIVVAISASGNSKNLVWAVDVAKQKGAVTVGISSFDGGELKQITDYSIHVPVEKGEYGPAEDAHMVLDHLVGNYLMRYVQNENNQS